MSDETPITGSGMSNVDRIGWVRVEHAQDLASASEGFNMFFSIAVAFLGAAVAAAVALATGPRHPLLLYLIVAGAGGIGAYSSFLAKRERGNVVRRRQNFQQQVRYQYVPSPFPPLNLSAGTNQFPSVTIGATGTPAEVNQSDQNAAPQQAEHSMDEA